MFDPTSGTTKVCENITNSIQLTILPELDNGNLLASQSICSNELPNNIQLVGAPSISTSITPVMSPFVSLKTIPLGASGDIDHEEIFPPNT